MVTTASRSTQTSPSHALTGTALYPQTADTSCYLATDLKNDNPSFTSGEFHSITTLLKSLHSRHESSIIFSEKKILADVITSLTSLVKYNNIAQIGGDHGVPYLSQNENSLYHEIFSCEDFTNMSDNQNDAVENIYESIDMLHRKGSTPPPDENSLYGCRMNGSLDSFMISDDINQCIEFHQDQNIDQPPALVDQFSDQNKEPRNCVVNRHVANQICDDITSYDSTSIDFSFATDISDISSTAFDRENKDNVDKVNQIRGTNTGYLETSFPFLESNLLPQIDRNITNGIENTLEYLEDTGLKQPKSPNREVNKMGEFEQEVELENNDTGQWHSLYKTCFLSDDALSSSISHHSTHSNSEQIVSLNNVTTV